MFLLKHSTSSQVIPIGIYLDSTDGDTAETGLTILNTDLQVWKTGATSLVNKNSGGATHMSIGVYQLTLDATDTNTLGPIKIYSHVSGALVVVFEGLIVPVTTYDAMITNGLNNLGGVAQTADNDTKLTSILAATVTDIPASLVTITNVANATLLDTGTTLPSQISSLNDFNPSSDTVANVTTVATTTTNTDMRGTDGANTTTPDNAGISSNGVAIGNLNDFNPSTDTVSNVTTVTTNSDMRGTDLAATALNLAIVDANVDSILVDTGNTLPNQISALNNIAATDIVSSGAITTLAGAVVTTSNLTGHTPQTGDSFVRIGLNGAGLSNINLPNQTMDITGNLSGSVGSVSSGVTVTTNNDKSGYSISGVKQTLDAMNDITGSQVMSSGDIDGFTLEESQKLILAGAAGETSGMETTTATIMAADDSKTRITATVDSDGNRSSVTLDVTG